MADMDEPMIVSRDIDLDLPADELWSLIADADSWQSWLVDEAEVDVEIGATGLVRDAGRTAGCAWTRSSTGERVTFEWWPADRPGDASAVELVVVPSPSAPCSTSPRRSRPGARAQASAAWFTWEVRALAAWAGAGRRAHV